MTNDKPINLLLVEDDSGDAELISEIFQDSAFNIDLTVIQNGSEAISYLKHIASNEPSSLPDLVLLDLNLPRKNGREVLHEIRADDGLHYIPVIILTTSNAQIDILESYQLGASCYITKPININEFIYTVRLLENFWFSLVSLPTQN